MKYTVLETHFIDERRFNAGGKAREDVHSILLESGFYEIELVCPQKIRESAGRIKKFFYHIVVSRKWNKAISVLNDKDILFLQFPVINHTLLLNNVIKKAKRKGVLIYAIIHDLETIRTANEDRTTGITRWRIKKEEIDELHEFDAIVVHNKYMKKFITDRFNIDEERLIELGLFDYLLPEDFEPYEETENKSSCIIAGNLNKNKSGFVYNLPDKPRFELYGINYDNKNSKENIKYHGAFPPEELPSHLSGGFGLVWDGDSADTCSGVWGNYLRYNNPHKTSLYLACGIPVIIWEEAALANYVLKHNVGITVKSIHKIDEAIAAISENEYKRMKINALRLSTKLRNGEHTKRVLKELEKNFKS